MKWIYKKFQYSKKPYRFDANQLAEFYSIEGWVEWQIWRWIFRPASARKQSIFGGRAKDRRPAPMAPMNPGRLRPLTKLSNLKIGINFNNFLFFWKPTARRKKQISAFNPFQQGTKNGNEALGFPQIGKYFLEKTLRMFNGIFEFNF